MFNVLDNFVWLTQCPFLNSKILQFDWCYIRYQIDIVYAQIINCLSTKHKDIEHLWRGDESIIIPKQQ